MVLSQDGCRSRSAILTFCRMLRGGCPTRVGRSAGTRAAVEGLPGELAVSRNPNAEQESRISTGPLISRRTAISRWACLARQSAGRWLRGGGINPGSPGKWRACVLMSPAVFSVRNRDPGLGLAPGDVRNGGQSAYPTLRPCDPRICVQREPAPGPRLSRTVLWSSVSSVDKRSTSALAIWVSPRATWASPIVSECAGQLVDQHGPGHRRLLAQLRLGHDRRHPAKIRRRVPVRHRITWSVLRRASQCVCRCCHRPRAVPFEASRPGGKEAGGFSGCPAPCGEVGHRYCSNFSMDLSMPPRSTPIVGNTNDGFSPWGNRPGGAPFDNRRLAILPRDLPELAQVRQGQVLWPASRHRTRSGAAPSCPYGDRIADHALSPPVSKRGRRSTPLPRNRRTNSASSLEATDASRTMRARVSRGGSAI